MFNKPLQTIKAGILGSNTCINKLAHRLVFSTCHILGLVVYHMSRTNLCLLLVKFDIIMIA